MTLILVFADSKRNTTPFRAEKYDGRGNKILVRKATKDLMKNQSQCVLYNP